MSPIEIVLTLTVSICALVDAATGFIPNRITYPAFALLLLLAAAQGHLPFALFGAASIGAALGALHLGTRGRGLGLGDVKLGACIGAALGAQTGLLAVESAFILGGMVGVLLLVLGKAQRKSTVRFGPFLALGVFVGILAQRIGMHT